MSEPHCGHSVEVQGVPNVRLTWAPHVGHTHVSPGPISEGRPVSFSLQLSAGTVPSFSGMYTTPFKSQVFSIPIFSIHCFGQVSIKPQKVDLFSPFLFGYMVSVSC